MNYSNKILFAIAALLQFGIVTSLLDGKINFWHRSISQKLAISGAIDTKRYSKPRDFDSGYAAEQEMMQQVGQHNLLTFEDEVDFSRKYRAGRFILQERQRLESELSREVADVELAKVVGKTVQELHETQMRGEEAKSTLVSSNMRLVFHIARYYKHRGVSYSDLIQEGTVGLMKAVEKYDPTRGFRFSTYASWWVKQAVSRAIAEQSRIVRIPVHIHDLLCTLHKVEKAFITEHDRKPSAMELAMEMALPVEKVELLIKCSREVKSMDESALANGSKSQKDLFLGDRLSSEHTPAIDQESEGGRGRLKFLVDRKLSGREAAVVEMRYGLSDGVAMTLEQVGRKLNVTRERIRQIEAKAIAKLREDDLTGEMKEIFQDPRVNAVKVAINSNGEFIPTIALVGESADLALKTRRFETRAKSIAADDFFSL